MPEFTIKFIDSEYDSCEQLLSKYKVVNTVGQGGQAQVKEAIDMET